jgi:hypothetical protein
MKLAYVLFAVVLSIYSAHAQSGSDSIFVQIYPDSVYISNINISALCGTSYMTSVSIAGDSIAILESDTSSMHAWCYCNFDVNLTLIGLAVGSYRTFIFRSNYLPRDTFFVGSVNFTIEQTNSPLFTINSYNSECHLITNIIDEGTEIPRTSSLLGNYPNPFNPVTIIRYQIHQRSKVKLEIFDELGRVITTLIDEEKPLGDYEIMWNGSKYSSGIYFCKLTVGNEIRTSKMTLAK